LIARAISGNPYGPLSEADAVRVRRLLFLVVDAGRPPAGEWAKELVGPSGVDIGLAAADTAIDAAARLSSDAFKIMMEEWRDSIVRFRCGLKEAEARRYLPPNQPWVCDDVRVYLGVIGFDSLGDERSKRLKEMPTRLSLTKDDIELAIQAGRDATRQNDVFRKYARERIVPKK
jgi:NTE family protein